VKDGAKSLFCLKCGGNVAIIRDSVEQVLDPSVSEGAERARLKTIFETALVLLQRVASTREPPTCFISYAWGNALQERWVAELADELQRAGVSVIFDRKDNSRVGMSLPRFMERLLNCDFVAVVGTPNYAEKAANASSPRGTNLASEMDLINQLLTGSENDKRRVLPLLLDGSDEIALPPFLRKRVYTDFRDPKLYFKSLFDLLLTIYGIPVDQATVSELRMSLDPAAY
jgi:hypothetical protein